MSLFTAVKDELESVGVHVEGALHDVLSKHLTIENIAAHVATDLQGLAGSPLFKVAAASAGLPPQVAADIAEFAGKAGAWLEHEAQPAA